MFRLRITRTVAARSGSSKHALAWLVAAVATFATAFGQAPQASADLARTGSTVLVSTFPDGTPADGGEPTVSADGRYVAFASWDKLLPDARDNCQSVYRKDMATGELLLLTPGTCSSYLPSLSADGNKVLYVRGFCRRDSMFLNNYCSGSRAYVRDIAAGTTIQVSNSAWGVEYVKLATDGNYAVVVHEEWESGRRGAHLVDARVPFSWATTSTIGVVGFTSFIADISGDGRYVVFESEGKHVAQDNDLTPDVYLFDRTTGAISLVGIHPLGEARYGRHPAISADGTVVVFRSSEVPNAVHPDNSIPGDVYARHLPTATTWRVSLNSIWISPIVGGEMQTAVSADGKLALFNTAVPQLSSDSNPGSDIYMRNIAAGRTSVVSVMPDGTQGVGYRESFDISDGGTFVAFESRLHPDLPNERRVYVRDLQVPCGLPVCPLDYP